ncbi:MAG: CPBP family glutamic-type intramembrane protease [Acidobacteriota bacterium]
MTSNKRLFLILWLAGMAGVLSFLLVDLSGLIAALPLPEGTAPPELPSPALLKLVVMIQPAVLVSLSVLIGVWLAPKVGLHAPLAEAFAERKPVMPALRPQVFPGIVAGLASGVAIVAVWVITKPFLPVEFVERALEFNKFIPHAVRVLYGGFFEELLLRWGLMTFLVWILFAIFGNRSAPAAKDEAASTDASAPGRDVSVSRPRGIFFIIAIVASAFVFGLGHLPLASVLAGGLTLPIVIYVLISNAVFGLVAGFLYWRRGLEAAMLAHIFAHVVLVAAIYFIA